MRRTTRRDALKATLFGAASAPFLPIEAGTARSNAASTAQQFGIDNGRQRKAELGHGSHRQPIIPGDHSDPAGMTDITTYSKTPPTVKRKLALSSSDKILLYGDSRSSTDYTWFKDAMTALTGATVYNGGFSGTTMSHQAADAQLQRIWDYGARLVIVLLGGNDPGSTGTIGTFDGSIPGEPTVSETDITTDYSGTYFIQAVSHIMRKLKGKYYNIRANAGLTGFESEVQKTALIDAVLKPMLVFCTDIPQQRIDNSNEYSLVTNHLRKRAGIIECSVRYGVPCVDLYKKCNFDMSIEPFYVRPTDMVTNNGVWYMDGLHPNKFGFRLISEILCAEIGV